MCIRFVLFFLLLYNLRQDLYGVGRDGGGSGGGGKVGGGGVWRMLGKMSNLSLIMLYLSGK